MTLQTRLTVSLAAGIALVIVGFQAVQTYKVHDDFERVGQANAKLIKTSLTSNAEDVQRAVEFGIRNGMDNGDMGVFNKVTSLKQELHGLDEFLLYNDQGRVAYSSTPSSLKSEMEPALKQQLFTKQERLLRETSNQLEIYQPYIVNKSCIECHPTWRVDSVAGVTLFRYSKAELTKAENDGLVATREAGSRGLKLAAFAVAGTLLATTILVALFIRPVAKRLDQVAESLDAGSTQVALAASQLASASQSLAECASEQASSLEETSASLEEVASMAKRNADSAGSAKELSTQTRAAADAGAADMLEMSHAMAEVKESSDNIAKIIRTIDEIAFQTNILALNAAVEAARAGESGLGFAVVADEVRKLAQRSAQAARETAGTIESTIQKSHRGAEISEKVTHSLEEIVLKARQVDELVGQIASASKEQTEGISQVNVAISQMDAITQSNAANAEESASASEELNGQAKMLKENVTELSRIVGNKRVDSDDACIHAPSTASDRISGNGHGRAPRSFATTKAAEVGAAPARGKLEDRELAEISNQDSFKDF